MSRGNVPSLGNKTLTVSDVGRDAVLYDVRHRPQDPQTRLPVGSQSGPTTYVSPKTGKQYILLTVGGARQSTDRGDYVIAYALPK
ncbi:hypothetical protein ACYZTR_25830 [Pseudomonas sp. Hz4]